MNIRTFKIFKLENTIRIKLFDLEIRLTYLKTWQEYLPGGDIIVEGSRCPDITALIKFISFTLDTDLRLWKESNLSAEHAGITCTTRLFSPPSKSYKKKL